MHHPPTRTLMPRNPSLLLLATLLSFAAPAASAADGPNIIVVMPDDMGYGDLGATGNPVIRTPHLDRIASQSAELTQFYVSPVCSPTRACLMTGRYNHRTRVVDTFKGRSMMDPGEVTIAEVLSDAGYATGIFGKWHLGDNYPLRPQDQGFDEVLVHRGGGLAQPSEPIENERRYTDPILFHNGRQKQYEGYCTDIYFDAAIDFMDRSRNAGQPFFVYLPPNAPHGPYHDVPEDLLDHYEAINLTPVLDGNLDTGHRDRVARVCAMIENIDQNLGKLDRFLGEAGLRKDTLLLFLTDNGPNTPRYVGPFRGKKSDVHEGGIRTVFYARWPGRLQASTKSDRIAAHIDVFPTLLAAAGVDVPAGVTIDGIDVLPLVDGASEDWPDRHLVLQAHRGDGPIPFHHIAVRNQQWKLVHPTGFRRESMPPDVPFELYRIPEDPGEEHNLADEHPGKVEELKDVYRKWLADVSSTRPDNYEPPRIIIGSDEEPVTHLSIQDWRVPPSQGWGSGGRWNVEVIDPGPYEVTLSWTEPIGEREVVLHAGEASFPGKLVEDATRVVFQEVTLPTGPIGISVDISGKIAGRKQAVRFVTLERQD